MSGGFPGISVRYWLVVETRGLFAGIGEYSNSMISML